MSMSRATHLFGKNHQVPKPDTVNREGYPAYTRSLEQQYVQTVFCNTIGHTYYASAHELLDEADRIHDEMMAKDPEFAAKAIVAAREQGFMRLQPVFGLAKLATVRPDLFERIFRRVVQIPPDLFDFMTILEGMGRGQGGRAVKRAIADFLNDVTEYWVVKYNFSKERSRGYNLTDAVRTAHPKPKNEKQKALFRYLVGKETDMSLLPQVAAYERFRNAKTKEERIAAIREGSLTHDIVTLYGEMDQDMWTALMLEMPVFALLRHLNALDRAGVLDANQGHVKELFTDKEVLRKSKILPFRFASAYRKVQKQWVRDVLSKAADLTFDNLPDITGRTMVALDISASMEGQYIEIGSLFAFALYKKTQGDSLFYLFNRHASDANPSMEEGILEQAARIYAHGGTDTGSPVRKLMEDGQKVDNIILITDEQQNTGSPFYAELTKYRRQFNPNAKTFIVDLSAYRSAMVPPTDDKTFYIYGWSNTVLNYIAFGSRGFADITESVRNIQI